MLTFPSVEAMTSDLPEADVVVGALRLTLMTRVSPETEKSTFFMMMLLRLRCGDVRCGRLVVNGRLAFRVGQGRAQGRLDARLFQRSLDVRVAHGRALDGVVDAGLRQVGVAQLIHHILDGGALDTQDARYSRHQVGQLVGIDWLHAYPLRQVVNGRAAPQRLGLVGPVLCTCCRWGAADFVAGES